MTGDWRDYREPPAWASDGTLSEAEALTLLLEDLVRSGWMIRDREVEGRHLAGNQVRVDAVLEVPDSDSWHPNARIWALEAKVPVLPHDSKDHAALVVQAVDYRYTAWDGFGPLPVMIWPEPFAAFVGGDHNAVARAILARFRVPPLVWVQGHGWWLGLNLTRMWSQRAGPNVNARRWDLAPKWGGQ